MLHTSYKEMISFDRVLLNFFYCHTQEKISIGLKTVRLPHSSSIAVDVWSEAAIADCTPVTAIQLNVNKIIGFSNQEVAWRVKKIKIS